MAELTVTDEVVEKKGMIPGGSRGAARRAFTFARVGSELSGAYRSDSAGARVARAKAGRRLNAAVYLEGRRNKHPRGVKRSFRSGSFIYGGRTGVYKSTDPISTLYAEIEKARSAFSGGSSKAFNRVGRIGMRAIKDGDTSRFSRASAAQRYLARRKRNAFRGGENWRTSLPKLRGGKYK